MTNPIGWLHPIDESDQWDGFNDPGVEHFLGNPLRHLAREVNQNSLDAQQASPVSVSFYKRTVPVGEIPNLDEFQTTFTACEQASEYEGEKARHFFAGAKKLFASGKPISVLTISDENTSGLMGPSENGTPFYAFTKGPGQSKKNSSTATGSFGIGKYAPYAVSALRTVFVHTHYETSGKPRGVLVQGKSVLMSHDIRNIRHQGVGFWGLKKRCQPVDPRDVSVPDWVRNVAHGGVREHCGTDLHILGFNASDTWREVLAASVIENFFAAIFKGALEVDVDGVYSISKHTIREMFLSTDLRSSIKGDKNEPEDFDNCYAYLSCLANDDNVIIEETENRELGRCRIYIVVRDDFPKKVCVVRNGMFITDQLDRLKRFNDFKPFAAVVECLSEKGNELLRKMEPPRHDDFEPLRLAEGSEQAKGKKALGDLATWVRSRLKRHAQNEVHETTELSELEAYFAAEDASDGSTEGQEPNPEGKVVVRQKAIPARAITGRRGGFGRTTQSKSGGRGKDSGGQGRGAGGMGEDGKEPLPLTNVRAVPTGDASARKLFLTANTSGEIYLRLEEMGADDTYPVRIISAEDGEIQEGSLKIRVREGERMEVEVKLSEAFDGALRVLAYEV